MTVTVTSFLTTMAGDPIISALDPTLVLKTIEQVQLETCSYGGLSEAVADQAVTLHVAHFLTLQNQSQASYANGGKVQSLKSKNDQITFFGNATDPFNLAQTGYGQRLKMLLELNYVAFCL